MRDLAQHRSTMVALDPNGSAVDPSALLAAERAAAKTQRGKLTAELYALSQSQAGIIPIWIWADVRESPPSKEQLLADSAFRNAHNATRLANVQAQTSSITAWLDAHGYAVSERGLQTPLILADVPASALAELGGLAGVAVIGYRRSETLTSAYWSQNIKVPSALAVVGSASGQPFCNTESDLPNYTGYMSLPTLYSTLPSVILPSHMQWTTELISIASPHVSNDTVAPSATTFVGDWGASTSPASWLWCIQQGANRINSSSEADG